MTAATLINSLAGLIVLAEALNKLERCDPGAPGLRPRERLAELLKAVAWLLLSYGAAAALATPVLLLMGVSTSLMLDVYGLAEPAPVDVAVLAGFAVLIVRTRVKEG